MTNTKEDLGETMTNEPKEITLCKNCGHYIVLSEGGKWFHLRWHPKYNPLLVGDIICLRKVDCNRPRRSRVIKSQECGCNKPEPKVKP